VHSLTQRGQDERRHAPRSPRTTPPAHAVLALQRSAGNQAVANLLQRAPKTEPKDEPPVAFEIFVGDGHAPDDVEYATKIGKADEVRLEKGGKLSPEDRRELNAKLTFFQGAAKDAYAALIRPALVVLRERKRDTDKGDVTAHLDAIKDLKQARLASWDKTAHSPEPKPDWVKVVEIVIPIVALGFGGIVDHAIANLLTRKGAGEYMNAFMSLAGLEAATMSAEALFQMSLSANRHDHHAGLQKSLVESGKAAKAGLDAKGDLIDTFVEAMRISIIDQGLYERTEFNASSAAMSEEELAGRSAGLKLTYDELLTDPSSFMRELTTGFIRLMDEVTLAKGDAEHGGDRDRTWHEEDDLRNSGPRLGNLMVFPWPRNHSLGKWDRPDASFDEFAIAGAGLNAATFNRLQGMAVRDLPLTLGFRFKVADPYYRVFKGDMGRSDAWFTRSSDGRFLLEHNDDDGEEWLASLYSRRSDEHTASERGANAVLGAEKLYNAIMGKTIGKINMDY
jgi:hypothetical protein